MGHEVLFKFIKFKVCIIIFSCIPLRFSLSIRLPIVRKNNNDWTVNGEASVAGLNSTLPRATVARDPNTEIFDHSRHRNYILPKFITILCVLVYCYYGGGGIRPYFHN